MTDRTGFLADLVVGRPRWDLMAPFPTPPPDDQRAGDKVVAEVRAFLAGRLDPLAVDENRLLPPQFLTDLRGSDYLRMQLPTADGGLGLSDFSTFRAISAFMAESVAAGFVVATHNGIGLPMLLPVLPPGPQRDLISRRIADGVLSGWADTESIGAANRRMTTTAIPVDSGYVLSGDKIFISNGPVADELIVGASTPGAEDAGLFVVNTRSPGFRVRARQEVLGLRGLPLGALTLEAVRVSADRVIVGPGRHWRDLPLLEPTSARGRVYLISSAALAMARRCLKFQRNFVTRRSVDHVGLADYPAIQHLVATSVADVYAIDTVTRWCLLGSDDGTNLDGRFLDRHAAKNINSLACWRVVDRTMSLLAAEGAETATSKRRRQASTLPMEQLFRDARVLRITGGVDFNVAFRGARLALDRCYTDVPRRAEPSDAVPAPIAARLSARNQAHLTATTVASRNLAVTCRELTRRHPDRTELFQQELIMIPLGMIMHELLAMSVVLARAATEDRDQQSVVDVYCTQARNRLAGLWRDLERADAEPYRRVTTQWLAADENSMAPL
ncbi:acyl-CoA dehydrogenase family protein [Actinocrispum wychmicini]|uniref:Alkylation response protein AidB-like acyl-CoA dehydrogenase n=1 Tax=Actinocrispum wychmicini TaxID=1213861 RepID=A0A4R2JBW9_9PSEU|nr:acyl-CoA dehydrogenase family protein [Actinocrispum wychmicini]TCO54266.1 alkylation response protein AidB-like acyl-CoA dehydrogenase [Actinocrispum wychmicini]